MLTGEEVIPKCAGVGVGDFDDDGRRSQIHHPFIFISTHLLFFFPCKAAADSLSFLKFGFDISKCQTVILMCF